MWNGISPRLALGDATLCRRKEEGMSTNNFTHSEIDRGLILIYVSHNAHSFVNFVLPCADLKEFCSSSDRKEELIFFCEHL